MCIPKIASCFLNGIYCLQRAPELQKLDYKLNKTFLIKNKIKKISGFR